MQDPKVRVTEDLAPEAAGLDEAKRMIDEVETRLKNVPAGRGLQAEYALKELEEAASALVAVAPDGARRAIRTSEAGEAAARGERVVPRWAGVDPDAVEDMIQEAAIRVAENDPRISSPQRRVVHPVREESRIGTELTEAQADLEARSVVEGPVERRDPTTGRVIDRTGRERFPEGTPRGYRPAAGVDEGYDEYFSASDEAARSKEEGVLRDEEIVPDPTAREGGNLPETQLALQKQGLDPQAAESPASAAMDRRLCRQRAAEAASPTVAARKVVRREFPEIPTGTEQPDIGNVRGAAAMIARMLGKEGGLLEAVARGAETGMRRTGRAAGSIAKLAKKAGQRDPEGLAAETLERRAAGAVRGGARVTETGEVSPREATEVTARECSVISGALADIVEIGLKNDPENPLLASDPITYAMNVLASIADRQSLAAAQKQGRLELTPSQIAAESRRDGEWRAKRAELDASWEAAREAGDERAMARIARERAALPRPERATGGAGLAARFGEGEIPDARERGGKTLQEKQAAEAGEEVGATFGKPLEVGSQEDILRRMEAARSSEETARLTAMSRRLMNRYGIGSPGDEHRHLNPFYEEIRQDIKKRTRRFTEDGEGLDIAEPAHWTDPEGRPLVRDTEELSVALSEAPGRWDQTESPFVQGKSGYFSEEDSWFPASEEQVEHARRLEERLKDEVLRFRDADAATALRDLDKVRRAAADRYGASILESSAWHRYAIDNLTLIRNRAKGVEPDKVDPTTLERVSAPERRATQRQTTKVQNDETWIVESMIQNGAKEREIEEFFQGLDEFVERDIFGRQAVVTNRSKWSLSQISKYIDRLNAVREQLGIPERPRKGRGMGH